LEWPAKQTQIVQRFTNWADDLSDGYVRLEARKTHDEPFRAVISRTFASSVHLSRVAATRHEVVRLRSHIAACTEDLCCIHLQLEGIGRYTQRDHLQICGPGDVAVTNVTEPFKVEVVRDYQALCFAISRELLPPSFFDRPRFMLSTTETGRALSRTLVSYSELCLSFQPSSEIAASFGKHIVELICHASDVGIGEAPERMSTPVILSMMLNYIDRHSNDPDLSALTLAQKFCCSVRYVHKLFASTQSSVGEHINNKRISVCTRDLLDNRSKQTVAEIAFAAGFNDISNFNKSFRRTNGMSPREFRRAMTSQPRDET
jgi:AraC family transcriptional regulator, positive regulator of tynA and feaB